MEVKDIGRILGAAALATLPPVTGLYVYGKMKDKRNSTGASALAGGLAMTALGVSVALLNYYMFGLDETAAQLTTLIGEKGDTATAGLRGVMSPRSAFGSGSFVVAGLPTRQRSGSRMFNPFTNNFRQVGTLSVTRRMGLANVERVGGCSGCR